MPPLWTVADADARRRVGDAAQRRAERMREADVRDQPVAEERGDAAARPIDELIGDHQVERLVLLLQAADGARREDVLDAQRLEAEDVGAEVQLRGHQPVAEAVPRQEGHALAAQRADDVRRRRLAERRLDAPLLPVGQFRHVVQTAAADDADRSRGS